MPQIRVEKSNSFSQISNRTLQDQTLSFKARGLLSYMLSLPQDWDYSIAGLAAKSDKDGISAVRSGLDELIAAKYIYRQQSRSSKGNFDGYEYIVYEVPQDFDETDDVSPSCDFPTTENLSPSCDFPMTDSPLSENRTQQIYNNTNKKKNKENPIVPNFIREICAAYAGDDAELLDAILGLLENRAVLPKPKPVRTARAMNGILRQLDKHSGGNRLIKLALLEKATLSNWLTVYPLKDDELPAASGQGFCEEGYDGI